MGHKNKPKSNHLTSLLVKVDESRDLQPPEEVIPIDFAIHEERGKDNKEIYLALTNLFPPSRKYANSPCWYLHDMTDQNFCMAIEQPNPHYKTIYAARCFVSAYLERIENRNKEVFTGDLNKYTLNELVDCKKLNIRTESRCFSSINITCIERFNHCLIVNGMIEVPTAMLNYELIHYFKQSCIDSNSNFTISHAETERLGISDFRCRSMIYAKVVIPKGDIIATGNVVVQTYDTEQRKPMVSTLCQNEAMTVSIG